jgi:hypothetical protein
MKKMSNNELQIPNDKITQFNEDSLLIGNNWEQFMNEVAPYWLFNNDFSDITFEKHSKEILESIKFYKIDNCTIEDTDSIFEYLNTRVKKYLTVAYSMNVPVCFGIIGSNGNTSIVIGIDPQTEDKTGTKSIKKFIESLLPDIALSEYEYKETGKKHFGVIGGTPSHKIDEKEQTFDYSALTRALNGKNYILLVMAKPINSDIISNKINTLTNIKDICHSISKRNISLQESMAHTDSKNESDTKTHNVNVSAYGGMIFPFALGGSVGYGFSSSKTIGTSVSDTITKGKTLGVEIQNSFATDLAKRAENAIIRLQKGLSTGLWQSAVCYSTEDNLSLNIIQGCMYSELAKPDQYALPPRPIPCDNFGRKEHSLIIPKNIFNIKEETKSSICSYSNTEELSLLFSLPDKNIPGYELRTGKQYPLSPTLSKDIEGIKLGNVCDGKTILDNTHFSLSNEDLNKHTFICGITGSGKTNTVKHIVSEVNVPFWVIECAKTEYRKLNLSEKKKNLLIYTVGRPEINSISFNPFYIMEGISPQLHIDFLKDLFNASFSFYGPMPYILEKCLHEIYRKRGFNLKVSSHPYLKKENNESAYNNDEHKYIFPTMQDLKYEIESYVKSMGYEGEFKANIKTAILARIESLCVGAKGFMLNTNKIPNFSSLINKNVIFELEGLADDSDKAFIVGIFIIFLTEYRRHEKEISTEYKNKLKHLLVIEEAHRLLKNISVEKTNEDIGNPKGKAVEHFTNMIAEMRSYGQGVIISEQIPSKIMPDVIKNSSNKIIHRIVARDDQSIIGNMIGMEDRDTIFIGDQIKGRALCHNEGMRLPISVAMPFMKEIDRKDGEIQLTAEEGQEKQILKSLLKSCLIELDSDIIRFLNTLLTYNVGNIEKSISVIKSKGMDTVKKHSPILLREKLYDETFAEIISECLIKHLFSGIYNSEKIPKNFTNKIKNGIHKPSDNSFDEICKLFKEIDDGNNMVIHIVSELVICFKYNNLDKNIILNKLIRSYFLIVDEGTIKKILDEIQERENNYECA